MTPEEKRKLLKREMLRDAIQSESDEEITPAVAPADAPRETTLKEDLIDATSAVSQGLSPLSDELAAGFQGAGDTIEGALGLRGPIDLDDAYRTHKNQYDKNIAISEERSPTMTKVGELGGAVLAPVNGETTAAKTIAAALVSALGGAGKSKANPLTDPVGLTVDTSLAGGLGAVGGLVGGKAAEHFGADGMLKIGEKSAERAVARGQQGAMKNMPDGAGRELIDKGVVSFGAKAGTMAERAVAESSKAGQALQKLMQETDEAIGEPFVNGRMIAERIRASVRKFSGRGNRATMARMLEEADAYEEMGLIPFTEAFLEKKSWKFDPNAAGDPIRGNPQASNALNRAVHGEIEDAFERLPAAMQTKPYLAPAFASGKSLKGEFNALNRTYGATQAAEDAAETLAARQDANLSFGLREWLAGAALGGGALGVDVFGGTGGGASITTAAAMIGAKLAKERGPAAVAIAADKFSRLQRAAPEFFNKIPVLKELQLNPMIGAVHLAMMESDPNYRVEVSNIETKAKAPRVQIGGLPLPMDRLGGDPFIEHPALAQEILAAQDGKGQIKSPEALAQLSDLVADSDDYDSVQKASLLSNIGRNGRIDISVAPEPPLMLQRPPARQAPPITTDRIKNALKAVSDG